MPDFVSIRCSLDSAATFIRNALLCNVPGLTTELLDASPSQIPQQKQQEPE
ncbi:MAG TPA: hypothetical protein VGN07_02975 [Steroidobacteraceae bacterium]